MRRRPSSRVGAAAVVALVLAVPLIDTLAAAGEDAATLEASAGRPLHGDVVTFSGGLTSRPECLEGRAVVLERRLAAEPLWREVAAGTSGAGGAFSLRVVADEVGDHRVVIASESRGATTCEEVISPEVRLRVRAAVGLRFSSNPLPASRCGWVRVSVLPEKPGQEVLVERRVEDAWTEIGRPVLDASSAARVRVCMGWRDLGAHGFRARWPRQDARNLAGTWGPRRLHVPKAPWMRWIDAVAAGESVGISVREGGAFLYRRGDTTRRIPASNQKLLLSMALMDALGPDRRLPTRALAPAPERGVIRGDLWVVGSGDPGVGRATLRALAGRVREAGIRRITGAVRGSTSFFARDWWADGWRSYFPRTLIPLPTALTFEGNVMAGRHVRDPERRAAAALTRRLRSLGVRVAGRPAMGRHPPGLPEVARVASRPLSGMLAVTNHSSSNFWAEVLGKRLAAAAAGPPGMIEKGAAAMADWARAHGGKNVAARDASGLSYENRASPAAISRMLGRAEAAPWGERLRATLPSGGAGTLAHRLLDVPVRAKTGTLRGISGLSGWVRSERTGTWIEFSILGSGSTSALKAAEDRIVRILWRNAR